MNPEISTEPEFGTVEHWAWNLIVAVSLEDKLRPGPPPTIWEESPPARRDLHPGRPPELQVADRSIKTPKPGALQRPEARASLCHTFFHHELQAAELLCWALLAFPDTPREFRSGLLVIARDELNHAELYRRHLGLLGFGLSDFPVRDWFWERVPSCTRPEQFCALFGIGLEGANLDHATTYAARFRRAGDEQGAELQERIAREEVAHVRFAVKWFETWVTEPNFESWCRALPAPLTPLLFRGKPLARELRLRAGMSAAFIEELTAFSAPLSRPFET